MSLAEIDLRHKAELRGFRIVKLDRVGQHCLLYSGGGIVAEGTLQQLSDHMDQTLIDAVCKLSPECKRAMAEILHHA